MIEFDFVVIRLPRLLLLATVLTIVCWLLYVWSKWMWAELINFSLWS